MYIIHIYSFLLFTIAPDISTTIDVSAETISADVTRDVIKKPDTRGKSKYCTCYEVVS